MDAGEPFLGDQNYTVLHADGNVGPAGPARAVASGGSGLVFRVQFKELGTRALKILAPREELLAEQSRTRFVETFQREIYTLSQITHTRLAKIMDAGVVTTEQGDFPFCAMDYVDGVHLSEVYTDDELTGTAFLDVIDQVLDGVEYLHEQEIMHSDLKEENILIQHRGGVFTTTVVDLGVAKTLKEPLEPEQEPVAPGAQAPLPAEVDPNLTYFFSTKKITREEWQPRLLREITRIELREMFPSHDLYALGTVIERALQAADLANRLRSNLGEGGLQALETIRDRLLLPPGLEYYRSATQLRRDWRKLQPGYLAPLSVGELAVGASARTSIATPAGRVSLTSRIAEVITHPLFQRLRHVPQLELLSLVYPGATHTRFLHALSTFDTARRYISHLLNDPNFRLMAEPIEIEATLLWALLHDIGHYPLSHMFEDLAEEEKQHGGPRSIPTDDDLFWAFVQPAELALAFADYPTVIADAARKAGAQPETSFRDHLLSGNRFGEDTLEVLQRINEPKVPSHSVLAGIISSPIDVDKVSYLHDDSMMTGVRYGLGLDLDALLASLRAPRESDIELGRPVIAINDKGLPAAEAVVLARLWMLKRVYWHHTSRATIAMVKFVLRHLLETNRLTMDGYFGDLLFETAVHAIRYLSVRMDEAAREGEQVEGRDLRNPLHGLLGGNRLLYKRVLTISRGMTDDDQRLHELLIAKRGEPFVDIMRDAHEIVEHLLGQRILWGDVLVDIPVREREQLGAPVLVYPNMGSEVGDRIERISPVVANVRDEFGRHVKKFRIFMHPERRAAMNPSEADELSRALLEMTMRRTGG
jgi:HD superfamily phosphohydrolase